MADGVCLEKMRLMEAAQAHLVALAELMHRSKELLAAETYNTLLAVDKEIENRLGEKERAMGALRQHQQDHGC